MADGSVSLDDFHSMLSHNGIHLGDSAEEQLYSDFNDIADSGIEDKSALLQSVTEYFVQEDAISLDFTSDAEELGEMDISSDIYDIASLQTEIGELTDLHSDVMETRSAVEDFIRDGIGSVTGRDGDEIFISAEENGKYQVEISDPDDPDSNVTKEYDSVSEVIEEFSDDAYNTLSAGWEADTEFSPDIDERIEAFSNDVADLAGWNPEENEDDPVDNDKNETIPDDAREFIEGMEADIDVRYGWAVESADDRYTAQEDRREYRENGDALREERNVLNDILKDGKSGETTVKGSSVSLSYTPDNEKGQWAVTEKQETYYGREKTTTEHYDSLPQAIERMSDRIEDAVGIYYLHPSLEGFDWHDGDSDSFKDFHDYKYNTETRHWEKVSDEKENAAANDKKDVADRAEDNTGSHDEKRQDDTGTKDPSYDVKADDSGNYADSANTEKFDFKDGEDDEDDAEDDNWDDWGDSEY